MTEVKFVSMPASELAQVIEKACENAVTKVLAAKAMSCLTLRNYVNVYRAYPTIHFKKLAKEHRFKDIKAVIRLRL